MARTLEVLIPPEVRNGQPLLRCLADSAIACGVRVTMRRSYAGNSHTLALYGVGSPAQAPIRKLHLARGGRALLWDAGYWQRAGADGYYRLSIDRDHPTPALIEATPDDPTRFDALRLRLTDEAQPAGPIILVGLGKKSRSYLRAPDWEARKLDELRQRFPGRKIIYRPKPRHPYPDIGIPADGITPIAKLLHGASLVVCRHSNVAVDATLAGVPSESEDGAALWLRGRPFDPATRLSFLRRLAHWQYRPSEMVCAWRFAERMLVEVNP